MPVCRVDYWEQLKDLKIFSLERRRERYMILYLYKIMIGLCPNPGLDRIPMNRRTTVVPKRSRKTEERIKNARHDSFFSRAPQIFNTLPEHLRNVVLPAVPTKQHVLDYKIELDKYLWRIPDQPSPNPEGVLRQALSNSLIDQTPSHMRRGVPKVKKCKKKNPDPLMDFRDMATNIKG